MKFLKFIGSFITFFISIILFTIIFLATITTSLYLFSKDTTSKYLIEKSNISNIIIDRDIFSLNSYLDNLKVNNKFKNNFLESKTLNNIIESVLIDSTKYILDNNNKYQINNDYYGTLVKNNENKLKKELNLNETESKFLTKTLNNYINSNGYKLTNKVNKIKDSSLLKYTNKIINKTNILISYYAIFSLIVLITLLEWSVKKSIKITGYMTITSSSLALITGLLVRFVSNIISYLNYNKLIDYNNIIKVISIPLANNILLASIITFLGALATIIICNLTDKEHIEDNNMDKL